MEPQSFLILLFILALFFFAKNVRSPRSKGNEGERRVSAGISRFLDKKTYRLFDNVTLAIGDGTTQIDHLVVSPYGIFVVETKNMTGWIFGDVDHARWTQIIYRSKQQFQNPLHQNAVHVRAVSDTLNVVPDYVYNVVVFVGSSTFKTPMPSEVVEGVSGLARFIRSKTEPVLSHYELDRICKWIEERRLEPSSRTDRMHVGNVRKRISRKASASNCPRCGSELVERINGNTGERFFGCVRFPRCRGSRSITTYDN
ncbi:MAG: NERD domain-containing protein [Alphaproteobacteria bacterium]|nr:NERD domain-containing protein [Alphaproteobacteria bacterium]